jgi:hypothetical protein
MRIEHKSNSFLSFNIVDEELKTLVRQLYKSIENVFMAEKMLNDGLIPIEDYHGIINGSFREIFYNTSEYLESNNMDAKWLGECRSSYFLVDDED